MSQNRQVVDENQREKDVKGSKQADFHAATEGKLREIHDTKENECLGKALNYVVRDQIRHAAYLRDNIQDVIQKYIQLEGHFMLTGSAGEGMINSNDWDLMFCMPEFVVIDTEHGFKHNKKKIYLLADTEQCNIGFTRLKLIENKKQTIESIGAFKKFFRRYNGAYYLFHSHQDYSLFHYISNNLFTNSPFTHVFPYKRHGPALTIKDIDIVLCLMCNLWDTLAPEFLKRQNLLRNYPRASLEEIKRLGFHLVLQGDKKALTVLTEATLSRHEKEEAKQDYVFRISFSVIEKYLIQHWTDQQLRIYFLLKEIIKDISNPLCSYHCKTIMFWAVERMDAAFWDQPITMTLQQIMKTFRQYVENRMFPHYFFPKKSILRTLTAYEYTHILNGIKKFSIESSHCFQPAFNNVEKHWSLQSFYVQQLVELTHFLYEYLQTLAECNIEKAVIKTSETFDKHFQYNENTGNIFKIYLQRLAYFYIQKRKRERTLLKSVNITGPLDDQGVSGNALLGLHYYCFNNIPKAVERLEAVIKTFNNQLSSTGTVPLIPIRMVQIFYLKIKIIKNDRTLFELFQAMDDFKIEPIVLSYYLLYKITTHSKYRSALEALQRSELQGYVYGETYDLNKDFFWRNRPYLHELDHVLNYIIEKTGEFG